MKKIFWISLGCPRNWVDTETMMEYAKQAGYTHVSSLKEADVCIINTCGFLEEARVESLATIQKVLKSKKKVIVCGCMVPKHKELLVQKFSGQLFGILGPGDLDKIVQILSSETNCLEVVSHKKSFLGQGSERTVATPSHYAYVKISEGCAKHCSYCIIPHIKGKLQSKHPDRIVQEVKALLEKGVKEIILVGQDLLDYGKDFGIAKEPLIQLLEKILLIDKKFWLRLLYVYPDNVPKSLLKLMAKDPRLCAYLDLPLQHVSDKILKLMNRKTSFASIQKLLHEARSIVPNIAIRSSFIVGFPKESDQDFEKLLQFVQKEKLDHVGVFCFSREPLAKAYHLNGQISESLKKERFKILSKAQSEICEEKNRQLIGKKFEVLLDGYHPESSFLATCRSYRQAPGIDNVIILNDLEKVLAFGEFAHVQIERGVGIDLLGKILSQ